MKPRELNNLGIPRGPLMKLAVQAVADAAASGLDRPAVRATVEAVVADPTAHRDDPVFGPLATALAGTPPPAFAERDRPAPWRRWGEDLESGSIDQMEAACRLPISVRGALMPDAHLGYGLPIGGVLATDNAVIPYAVGVDIACRMKLTVLDLPVGSLRGETDRLVAALEEETRFGIGAKFDRPNEHQVMDDDWEVSPITSRHKDKARSQLGTSGSGNHFVEYGVLSLDERDLGLVPGRYLAVLSHSGSRGTGASVADHYSKLAMDRHPELPRQLRHLAWLDLDDEAGREYWAAMELMGRYAAANHAVIHRRIARRLRADVLADIENHHNFAWRERHDGRELIVHRKGATPAGPDALGIIPGSMADPAYVVRGTGSDASMHSASHGAGRVMSRRKAKESLTWSDAKRLLREREVTLLSAGLDEVPMVYKNIDEVMAAQSDLVRTVARFDPKIVKMAPGGRAED